MSDPTDLPTPALTTEDATTLRLDTEALAALAADAKTIATAAPARVSADLERTGDFIGRYRLITELGEGGFGVVWRAEQSEPIHREVALKVIKPGMDSREIIARFEAERQALALMDHPNIAGVLDAGTTDNGRPFFVMELVKGVPITEYCDTHRLTIRQRLELFIPVCRAVHHAHQKAILHRDLKPSNILVTEVDDKAVPKVIDFGIAKALGTSPEAALQVSLLQTQAGMVIGTPQYMSPEQAGATRDLDTRSDIFTLGVILFELLTGDTPLSRDSLRNAALDEVLRLVREAEPRRPSSRVVPVTARAQQTSTDRRTEPARLNRTLRGDLDWITLKALEKERERRYGSAVDLADDLERHLNHEPVEAGPPSALYRFRKLVQRNRLAVSAAAAMLVLLIAGIAVSTWQAVRATRAETQVSQERDRQDEQLWSASRGDHEAAIRAFDERHHARGLAHLERALEYRPANAGALVASAFHAFGINVPLWQPRLFCCYPRESSVEGVVFSPDGRYLAASCGKTLNVIDHATGRDVLRMELAVSQGLLAFSPDSRLLVVGGWDNVVRLLDVKSGKELWVSEFGNRPQSVLISPDGQHVVASSYDKSLRVLALKTGRLEHEIKSPTGFASLCFDPGTGRIMLALKDETVQAMDLETGKMTALVRLGAKITSLAVSANGRFLAAACVDESLALVDLHTVHVSHKLSFEDGLPKRERLSPLCFSPDGGLVAVGRDRFTILIDVASGSKIGEVKSDYGPTAFSFSPDGHHLAIGCWDNQVVMIEVETNKEVFRAELGVSVVATNFSPDGGCLAVGTQEGFAVIFQPTDSPVIDRRRRGTWAGVSAGIPNGPRVAVRESGDLQIGDAITGKRMDRLEIRSSPHAFSADGRYHAALSGRAASVYEIATGRKVSETSFDGIVHTVCFSADARCYAAGCSDNTVQWVEVATGVKIDSTPFPSPINILSLSPDGRHLAAASSSSMTAYWLDAKEGAKMNNIRCGGALSALSFSADGRHMAIGSRDDPVHIIDIATGQKVSSAEHGLNLLVSSLSFSPDGRCLLVGGEDKAARLFETTSGKELAKIEFETNVFWVGFADEHHFAALGQDGTVHQAECAWFDTRDDLAISWRSGLQLQSGFRFQPDGRLVPLSLEERIAAQDDVIRFVSSKPSPSHRWQHDILKWSRMLPQERTVSPWSGAPARVVIANKLMQ
ncbi:MAG: protein kinase, partial [Prosthecobacter sp.]|nr:protein kinase [Prosthecobacter sp.]